MGARGPKSIAGRDENICARFRLGETMPEIGADLGVSRQRIEQILKRNGLSGKAGGVRVKKEKGEKIRQAKKDARSIKKWGCSYERYRYLKGHADKPTWLFQQQRRNAMTRGIGWNLTLWDWWQIWQDSGHWDERGRGLGKYCMCRVMDTGDYELGNVYIDLASNNSSLGKNISRVIPKDKPAHHALIMLAGGPSAVGKALGLSANYINCLGCHESLPESWKTNGNYDALIQMAAKNKQAA